MERLSDVWAFPAGAGRAVAVSHGHFTNSNRVAVRPFSFGSIQFTESEPFGLPSLTSIIKPHSMFYGDVVTIIIINDYYKR